jgi:hypothetical protein
MTKGEGMPPVLQSYTHQLKFEDQGSVYSVVTSLTEAQDMLEIVTDQGALCSLRHTSTQFTMVGADEQGHSFTLMVSAGPRKKMRAELQISGRLFTAENDAENVISDLLDDVGRVAEMKESLPKSVGLARLARGVKANHKLVSLLVGYTKPAKKIMAAGNYCTSVCACCEKGSWLSAWCCISCASCDYFKNPYQSAIGNILEGYES